MTELAAIADTFGSSEPIFKVTLDYSGDLKFDVKDKYMAPESYDPVHQVVAGTWHETLDVKGGRHISQVDLDGAQRVIVRTSIEIVVNASTLKNPKQSQLYKWLQEHKPRYHNSSSVGFIALYRYIIANDIADTRDNTNPHAINVIAILELMKEKYEN